jgi:hypothetical protein
MSKTSLVVAVICFALAALIFVFADGARRVYAGAFFVMLGLVTVVNAKRRTQKQQ